MLHSVNLDIYKYWWLSSLNRIIKGSCKSKAATSKLVNIRAECYVASCEA